MAFFLLLWMLGATTEKAAQGHRRLFHAHARPDAREVGRRSNGPVRRRQHHRQGSLSAQGRADRLQEHHHPQGRLRRPEGRRRRDPRARPRPLPAASAEARCSAWRRTRRSTASPRTSASPRRPRGCASTSSTAPTSRCSRSDRTSLTPRAAQLIGDVASTIGGVPNGVIVRGHTDSLPYAAGRDVNNWTLSSARAEATRKRLADGGVTADRFVRIEGVADREPYMPADIYDPRNRRMSITLAWTDGGADVQAIQAMQSQVAGGSGPPLRPRPPPPPPTKERAVSSAVDPPTSGAITWANTPNATTTAITGSSPTTPRRSPCSRTSITPSARCSTRPRTSRAGR